MSHSCQSRWMEYGLLLRLVRLMNLILNVSCVALMNLILNVSCLIRIGGRKPFVILWEKPLVLACIWTFIDQLLSNMI